MEIKFRLWDKKKKKMYYGYEPDRPNMIDFDGKIYVTGSTGPMCDCGCSADYINWCNPGDYELMQYTGRKDIKETEIYESDIIEGEIWNNLFGYYIKIRLVVKWDKSGYWTYEDKGHKFVGGYLSDVKNVKIIGNIYQNPGLELLEEVRNE